MRLVPDFHSTALERQHAYPAKEAHSRVGQSFKNGETIEGIDDLRSQLTVPWDNDVLQKIENGDWLLVKEEAYTFDWAKLDAGAKAQKKHHRVMTLMEARPEPETYYENYFLMTRDREQALDVKRCITTVNGEEKKQTTDSVGVAYVLLSLKETRKVIEFRM